MSTVGEAWNVGESHLAWEECIVQWVEVVLTRQAHMGNSCLGLV
jgi:hypothetical protein